MVTVAIAAVLLGIALPAFNGFVEQRRFTAQVNDFLVSVQYARSEATRNGGSVSIIAENAADATNEWGAGWCLVLGSPAGCPDPTDPLTLKYVASLNPNTLNGAGALNTVDRLTFNSRGVLDGAVGGTLDLCGQAGSRGRRVSIAPTGRASSSEVVCP